MRRARGELDQAAQDLGDAPCLCDAAACCIWRRCVKDLADAADSGVAQMSVERVQERSRLVVSARMHTQPRVDERTDEPGPDRSLVIRGVSRAQIAEVLRLEVGMMLVEGAKAVGRQQPVGDNVEDGRPL